MLAKVFQKLRIPLSRLIPQIRNFSTKVKNHNDKTEHSLKEDHDSHEKDQHQVEYTDETFPFSKTLSPNRKTATMYYSDPEAIAYKVCAIIALHDELKQNEIKLEHTWKQLGISEVGKIEIILELENEFMISLPDEETEKFRNVYEMVQYIAKSPYLH